jgi:DNA-binding YbaB/EbfC family protein
VSDSFDLNSLLGQAMEMQQQLMAAQAEAAQAEVTGTSGGGAVRITVTGGLDVRAVEIRPDAVDPDDVGLLEDLVLGALNDAMDQLGQLQQSSLGGLDLGGVPGLGDLAGGLGGGTGGGPAQALEGSFSLEAFMEADVVDDDDLDDEDDEDDEAGGPEAGDGPPAGGPPRA